MGIKGLTNLLKDEAPKSIKTRNLKDYFGLVIAVDTNIWIYQFLIANGNLKNKKGQQTGHIFGMLQRTIAFLETNIKPIYVFDGPPPDLKRKHTIAGRNMRRDEAVKTLGDFSGAALEASFVCDDNPAFKKQRCDTPPSKAISVLPSVGHKDRAVKPVIRHTVPCQGAKEEVQAAMKRLVKPTTQQFNECKQLCGLLGVPVIEAPAEGEAQCAQLCKESKAYAVASEDSDCLPFGAPLFLRDFNCNKSTPVKEFNSAMVLDELKLSQDEFIDFCILCGCDYCADIEGMDPKIALGLIRKYHSIEKILEAKSYEIPKDWQEARELFKKPTVIVHVHDLCWTKLDEEGLTQFLENENDFSKANVEKFIERIKNAKKKKAAQTRMERFFPTASTSGRQ